MKSLPDNATLLIIDLQMAIEDPRWRADGPRNNPQAERNVAALLTAWRWHKRPIVHIRHDSTEPDSAYRPDRPSHAFKPEAMPLPDECVFGKSVNSAFIGTMLDDWLRNKKIETLVVAGVITNNSVETTVRHAGNLGYDVRLVQDATFTFAKRDWSGHLRSAQEVHDLSLANLSGEYATITDTAAILATIA
ncbi:cysteine hydrolase family protein [Azospirillum griseum]|uniref:Cysteine hydrolase n=1 Tax=Azospirillum griseum TaxID=2496639 RepID=A0A431VI16_9PROT|nr:cysteine hydrolase family protein [Azospirillum griseum]RTR20607.1 cysteine hydrolase [Azospirillum griseum]